MIECAHQFIFCFYVIADLKSFSWCNVIEQVKKTTNKKNLRFKINIYFLQIFSYEYFMQMHISGGSRISRRGGAWTSDVGAFWQKCMRKQKNLVP